MVFWPKNHNQSGIIMQNVAKTPLFSIFHNFRCHHVIQHAKLPPGTYFGLIHRKMNFWSFFDAEKLKFDHICHKSGMSAASDIKIEKQILFSQAIRQRILSLIAQTQQELFNFQNGIKFF